mgnify:CR=1 FL=1
MVVVIAGGGRWKKRDMVGVFILFRYFLVRCILKFCVFGVIFKVCYCKLYKQKQFVEKKKKNP